MAYSDEPKVPKGFSNLAEAWNTPLPKAGDKHVFNVIGVCTDFLECCKTRGTDYTMKFTLNDPYYADRYGLSFQVFVEKPTLAPAIKNQGDVVILRNAEIYNSAGRGKYASLKKGIFNWVVIEHTSLSESATDGSGPKMHKSKRHTAEAPEPTPEEIQYAKSILAHEDSSGWQAPAPSTALQINATMTANGGTPKPFTGKHRLVSELQIPSDNRCYVDLTVEIRRIYQTDFRLDCYVTDYSENQHLYNYSPVSVSGYDPGDPYNYTDNNASLATWTGPWGKRTITIILWEPHRSYAIQNFIAGSFVSLRNVHIKLDPQGAKLDGAIHGDHINPDKILVSKLSPGDAEWHDNLKNLLQRKRAHEQYCKDSGLPFIRDADPKQLKKSQLNASGKRSADRALESNAADPHENVRAKKNRKKKEKQRAKAAAKAGLPNSNTATGNGELSVDTNVASLAPNAHIRTNVSAASLIRIDEILHPDMLERSTPKGNRWQAPFQNARYKSKVVVVDYYPRILEEFAVKVRKSQYAVLDGASGDEDVNEDILMDGGSEAGRSDRMDVDTEDEDGSEAAEGDDGLRWEWRFMLVVQDPSPAKRAGSHHNTAGKEENQRPKQIELMVSGQDAEYLLREEACNLRRNGKALARLREKMFVLWGDLQERIEEEVKTTAAGTVNGTVGAQAVGGGANSQPFECYIAEYGVKKHSTAGDVAEDWERCWKMVHTSVA